MNNQLPADVQKRINSDANTAAKNFFGTIIEMKAYRDGYIAGATAETGRIDEEIDNALHAERNKMQVKFSEADKQWAALLKQREDKAQVLIDALDQFISFHETGLLPARHVYEKAVAARKQWKEQKEVGNG